MTMALLILFLLCLTTLVILVWSYVNEVRRDQKQAYKEYQDELRSWNEDN